MQPKKQVFISVGSHRDLSALHLYAQQRLDVDWTVPREANIGDRLYLIVPSLSGPIRAYGTITDTPYKTLDFGGKHRATVSAIELLDIPVLLDDLKQKFPSWAYLQNAKSYTKVPNELVEELEAFIHAYQDAPDWKALLALERSEAILSTALHATEDGDEESLIDYNDEEDGFAEDEERVIVSIKKRRGQTVFRQQLLVAYEGKCAVSDVDVSDVLEAAHIRPYKSSKSNEVSNGLLLRADLHTLFDLNLLAIQPSDYQILLSPLVSKAPVYRYLTTKKLRLPMRPEFYPNQSALEERAKKLR